MNTQLSSFVLVATLGLAACSSTNCDPKRAGFLEGINCENGQGYARREYFLQQGLAQAQAEKLEQRASALSEADRAAQAKADLAARSREISSLDSTLATLRRRVNAAAARNNVDEERINTISRELADLERQQEAAHRAAIGMSDDLAAIRQRQSKLIQLLDELN
jgi:chromosome segregation ATPase